MNYIFRRVKYLFDNAARDPSGVEISVCKLTRTNWVDTEATWNQYKSGSGWSSAGGDYVTTSPTKGVANCPSIPNWMNVDITAIVRQDAQGATEGRGMLL